jgi:tetratricopeptide (TPR) repeat protein
MKLLAEAARRGRTSAAITATVEIGRKLDEEQGAFALDDQLTAADEAVTLDPDALAPRLLRARLLLEADRGADALVDADAALRIAPDDPRALVLRGRALLAAGRAAEASRTLQGLVGSELARSDPSILAYAIRADAAAADGGEVSPLLETTVRDRLPGWHEGWTLLADEYDRAGRPDDAARARRNAATIVRNRAAQFRHDGLAALWSGATDEAIANFTSAVRLDPDDRRSQDELERLLSARSSPSSP